MYNPSIKREVIRRTYKILGPTVPSQTRPEYEIDEDDNVINTTGTQDTVDVTADVNYYKYLVGTIRCEDDDLAIYMTVDVMEEIFADKDGLLIVACRRRLNPTANSNRCVRTISNLFIFTILFR